MRTKPLVLVVEDDEDTREVYAMALRDSGLDVETARDGQEGLEKAIAMVPNVIVTDLRLPQLDGWALTRRVKANPRTRHIPIIAVSGQYLMQELADRARATGFASCLLKPCSPHDLVTDVKAALSPPATDKIVR
jgi:two-component system, cell cycle response regulator DivK